MIGLVGEDAYGDQLIGSLEAAGVRRRYVRRNPSRSSGVAMIFIDDHGENYVNTVYGANGCCDEQQVTDVREAMEGAAVLLVQHETPLGVTLEAMAAAREAGAAVILNPAPPRSPLPEGFLAACDLLTPNAHEAAELSGFPVESADAARQAARQIRRTGPGIVIVTLGQAGVWMEGEDFSGLVPAPAVQVVATVGAGDAFNGGLAAGLAMGLDHLEAVRLGVAAGAVCVTRPGAQEAMPTFSELESVLRGG